MRPSLKYKVIYRHRDKYPITEMCKFFGVSRSGYYSYIKKIDQPDRDKDIAEKIQECQSKHHKTYGYRRVQIWLERQGIYRNPKTILRIMKKYDLLSSMRRGRYYRAHETVHRYANIMNQDFHTDRPNQKWVTDITYLSTSQGYLYLSVIRDLFDNSIIAYRTSTTLSNNFVLQTIKDAVKNERVTAELQLHSDQGVQYTSQAYFSLTQLYGITPSMSRQGNPYDNAPAENFFSILKTECFHRVRLKTFEEARQLVDEYIHFYNHERIQLKTKLTPLEKRRQFVS